MLGAVFTFLGFILFGGIIGFIGSLFPSKSKWVEKKFPNLANKLCNELNLEKTNEEALIGITIGPETSNHIILGKNKEYLSVKYLYNVKKFSHDILEWKYDQAQSIDDIIFSIKTNIENVEPLPNHNS